MALELIVKLVAFWAVATGGLELFAAIRLGREFPGEFPLAVAGAASVVLGFAVLFWPAAGAVALVSVLGGYALVFGTSMLLYAFRIRGSVRRLERTDRDVTSEPPPV